MVFDPGTDALPEPDVFCFVEDFPVAFSDFLTFPGLVPEGALPGGRVDFVPDGSGDFPDGDPGVTDFFGDDFCEDFGVF